MRIPTLVTSAVLAALVAAPQFANAQGRHERSGGERSGGERAQRGPSRGDNGGGGQREAGARAAQPRQAPQERQVAPPQSRGDYQRGDNQVAEQRREGRARNQEARRPEARGPEGRGPEGRGPQTVRPRGGDYNRNRDDGRYAVRRDGPAPRYRDGDRRVYAQPRNNYYVYRYPSYRYGNSYGYTGYSYFDPGFRGDFFWGTDGWRSRYYYGGTYYSSGYNYDLGKLRLQVRQRDAEVYIDGYYAGIVDDFDGRLQGLQLEAGNYSVEIVAPDYEPLDFDVHVGGGRTTTYRGELLPERP